MKIQNSAAIATTKERQDLVAIMEAGLEAIDTKKAVTTHAKREGNRLTLAGKTFDLTKLGKIIVIGVGKCSSEAAAELEVILKDRITDGIVIDVSPSDHLEHIRSFVGTHPFPSKINADATSQIIELLKGLTEQDLVVFIISGGGSTLLCQPENFTCQNEADLIQCLMKHGAIVQDLNIVRKHMSLARGGHLAKYAYPATSVALIFSDVPGNDLSTIASGPTVFDKTTIEDARKVLDRFNTYAACGFNPQHLIETPKEEKYFEKVTNTIIVSNEIALNAMAGKARELGYDPHIVTTALTGRARYVGESLAKEIENAKGKTVNLYGGETTVEVIGDGKGGRNQEMVLAAGRLLTSNTIFMAVASDGIDNTPVAGAVADGGMLVKAKQLNLNPEDSLARNDSYTFFQTMKDFVQTGNTGSNISDLIATLKS